MSCNRQDGANTPDLDSGAVLDATMTKNMLWSVGNTGSVSLAEIAAIVVVSTMVTSPRQSNFSCE